MNFGFQIADLELKNISKISAIRNPKPEINGYTLSRRGGLWMWGSIFSPMELPQNEQL
jgi:hypothetical protein